MRSSGCSKNIAMLFTPKDLQHREEVQALEHHRLRAARFVNEEVGRTLEQQFGQLAMGEAVHFATGTKWSLHDLLVYCLQQTGPAHLHLCMYAVKEKQVELLARLKAQKLLLSINAVLYYRADKNDAGAFQLLQNISEQFGLLRTHAKLCVLQNEQWGISIVGSANLTTNTQHDVGVLTCDRTIADNWITWITQNRNDGTE